jgi:hypothetical protein
VGDVNGTRSGVVALWHITTIGSHFAVAADVVYVVRIDADNCSFWGGSVVLC